MSVRVRFAPSPTGFLHVGGARTALFNWLYARGRGGVFVLRIEDTDRDRSSDEMTQAILDGMKWLGLNWDEGPFHQADGFDRHREDVERLIAAGHAYRCFCSAEDVQSRREEAEAVGGPGSYRYDRRCLSLGAEAEHRAAAGEPHAVRFRVPEGSTEWNDIVHGDTRYENADIEDFVLLRTDGTPTYNLAVVSDDIAMEITHVIRGDDHLSNTPKQILLYRALQAQEPFFAHVPMILGADGKRLSKRHGATAVGEYQALGILPGALLNFLALLGWNPGDEQEIMQQHELIARFSLDRINKKSAIFDPEKLEWMNGQHIQATPAHQLVPLVAPQLIAEGLITQEEVSAREDWLASVIDLLKPRGRTVKAIAEQARMFLTPMVEYDPSAVAKQWKDASAAAASLEAVRAALETLEPWEPAAIEETLRRVAERLGVGLGKVAQPLRLALTGGLASPGIDHVVFLLGPDEVRRRIEAALEFLSATGSSDRP